MSSPIVTDEEIEKEREEDLFGTEAKTLPKQTVESIMKMDRMRPSNNKPKFENKAEAKDFVTAEKAEEVEKELEKDIPSNYIEVKLISNGRIEGIPEVLHFRCYSASDALDLNVEDEDKPKAITKVLTRLCYEKFDVGLLTVEDILFILYKLHGSFISPTITRKVYIDDKIEDVELLNDESNLEDVDISLNSMVYAYLGKDYDDNDIEKRFKVPFTIKDNLTGDSISFRFSTVKDVLTAQAYCKKHYKDEFIKYAEVRAMIGKFRSIKDEDKQDDAIQEYITKNEDLASEYYDFMNDYTKMIGEVTQAETIVAYNGKKLEKLEDKWDCYVNNLSYDIWQSYNKVIETYPFGFKEDIEVYLPSLKKKVHRRVGFQFDDFLHVDRHENADRYTVEFD